MRTPSNRENTKMIQVNENKQSTAKKSGCICSIKMHEQIYMLQQVQKTQSTRTTRITDGHNTFTNLI